MTSVTVIMPAHNAERYIAQAIQSVLWQTHKDFKLWILENGSTDATLQVARSFGDERITVFELGKVGFQGALDFAIRNAKTPWLARMDADDLMFPTRLERQMVLLQKNSKLVFVGTHRCLLTPFGHILDRLPLPPTGPVDSHRLATRRGFVDPSVIFSRKAALQVGGMDPEFTVGDIALWFRLLEKGCGWQLSEALHLYRLVSSSLSRKAASMDECARVWKKYVPTITPKWAGKIRHTHFWAMIASLELVVGDRNAVRRAARELEHAGEIKEAGVMRWRARLGIVGTGYYRFRNRTNYRHRPDLERLFRQQLLFAVNSPAAAKDVLAALAH